MKSILLFTTLSLFCTIFSYAKKNTKPAIVWRAVIKRTDGNEIVFNFEEQQKNKKPVLYILNAAERLRVDSVRFTDDSVFIKMPVFESAFKAKKSNNRWSGVWIKGTTGAEQVLPFEAEKTDKRFSLTNGTAKTNINGRWAVTFAADSSSGSGGSIAEFKQKGNKLAGTFLTPTGDYRFLEGVVTGNKLMLSGFDGGHAMLFTADINNNKLQNGHYYSGAKYSEAWSAVKNANATVTTDEVAMFLKPDEDKLNFRFPDINGNTVSINDDRFKNKVVVVQLMGSWCPNCMDETAFLSDYYNKNKQRGIEMVALAYEYSTNFQRSQKSLEKFRQRFDVQYPVLITGVTVSDTLRTEKTLPQVTKIKVFPSSIIIDKKGKVRKFDTGFFGPGTGEHYEAYKKDFYNTVNNLLAEK